MNPHDLKWKETQIAKLDAEITSEKDRLKREQKILQDKIREKGKLERAVEAAIKAQEGPVITEHAILRYLERVKGVDLEQIKDEMLPAKTKELIKQLGTGIYPIYGGKLKVQDNRVITVITKEMT